AGYGKLLTEAHQQALKSRETESPPLAVSRPSTTNDPAEELRQVLYGEKSPTVFTTEEARKLRLFDRATSDKYRNLQKNIDSFKANSPVAPPRAMVLNDAAKPTEPRVFIRGNQARQGAIV